jgi:antitoxin ParD1/3/4/toxin ParE1/3/4
MQAPPYNLSSAARLDLLQIWNYLAEAASISVADKVLADIELAIRDVAELPGRGHKRPDLTKRNILFYLVHSYFVVYRPGQEPLHLIRIVHTKRNVKDLLK